MNHRTAATATDLNLVLFLVRPTVRPAQEGDISLVDRRLEAQLSIIGRVCIGSLIIALGFVLLAVILGSPFALVGTVAGLIVTAAVLRVGEVQRKRYVTAQRLRQAQENEL